MEICLYFSNNNQFDIRELSTIDTFPDITAENAGEINFETIGYLAKQFHKVYT